MPISNEEEDAEINRIAAHLRKMFQEIGATPDYAVDAMNYYIAQTYHCNGISHERMIHIVNEALNFYKHIWEEKNEVD